jgi:hypothetical protein
LAMSITKASVILLLLCVLVIPIIQVGVVNGAKGGGGGGITGGGPRPPSPRPNPPRPNPPINVNPPPNVNLPTARPTMAQPTIALPTARPTVSVSFTRSLATSFTFTRSSWTGISFTRTFETSYTLSPTFTYMTTTSWGIPGPEYWYPGMGFWHYGTGYSASTGSFTLGQTLYDQNNNPCLYFTYFEFNAPAGQSISAQVWTTGSPVHFLIVPMAVISQYESPSSCSDLGQRNVNLLSQIQSFGSTPYTLNWTAPQNGQYAIIFFSTTPYSNTVYFVPQ